MKLDNELTTALDSLFDKGTLVFSKWLTAHKAVCSKCGDMPVSDVDIIIVDYESVLLDNTDKSGVEFAYRCPSCSSQVKIVRKK